jgi:hypothetical protein
LDAVNRLEESIRRSVERTQVAANGMPTQDTRPIVRYLFLSDTLVITASYAHRKVDRDIPVYLAFGEFLVTELAVEAFRTAAFHDPPLLLRGAINSGDFVLHGNQILGPAVDRAAALMATPDGAFIVRDPASAWGPTFGTYYTSYAVPMKGVGRIQLPAIDPMVDLGPEKAAQLHTSVIRAFGANVTDLGILAKRLNTDNFLCWLRMEKWPDVEIEPIGAPSEPP